MVIEYITYNHLVHIIKNNLYKIPRDIKCIIGIPRSGMIPALLIGEYLNKPVIDAANYLNNGKFGMGRKGNLVDLSLLSNKVLVIDDTCCSGQAIEKIKKQLADKNDGIEYIYCVCFLDGQYKNVDICFKDFEFDKTYTKHPLPILYEWNIFHKGNYVTLNSLYDLDGVLCMDPPPDSDTAAYESYLPNAVPLFTPNSILGGIITYRLSKYEDVTKKWLEDNHIQYKNLQMIPCKDRFERYNTIKSSVYKGEIYKNTD